jgi:DNA-binding NtrC family response regulator
MRPIKLLVVIASNYTPDQLIEKGFNPAIVFRITKNYFHVPPLRQRKEDIAVFINHLLSKVAKDYKLKRIDPHGMRLLCELPWPDNYRGVKGLIDHILFKRRQKEIEHPEITYDEVLQAITERDVMKKVVPGGKTIQRIELIEKG